jgi:hypothetical protein
MIPNSRVAPIEIFKKLGNTENESEGSAAVRLILHNSDVEGRTGRKGWTPQHHVVQTRACRSWLEIVLAAGENCLGDQQ